LTSKENIVPKSYDETTVSNASELIINDEYASLVPEISEQEYQSIRQSIKDNGQWVPIIVNAQRIILDGHTRFRACKELGLVPRTLTHDFEDPLLEKKFIIEINRKRRHLNDFQRCELQFILESIESELAKKRMSEAGKIGAEKRWKTIGEVQEQKESVSIDRVIQNNTTPSNVPKLATKTKAKGRVIDISAKNAQVSPTTYYKAREIIKQAPSEEILNKLRKGSRSINKVFRQQQNQKKMKILLSNGVNVQFPDSIQLIEGDFIEKCKVIPDNSIDLIFTDPPYHKEWLPYYEPLGKIAFRVLKEGGSLVMYAGHHALPQIFKYMENSGLKYWWINKIDHKGSGARMFYKNIIVTWKPLLWYVKGNEPNLFEYIKDSVESERPDKTLSPLVQSTVEAEYMISSLTIQDGVVLDPLAGTCTTAIAAIKLKRRIICIEKDAEMLQKARDRISKYSVSYNVDIFV
jgi:16S rRNA G966 N2-methylase RsmD